MLLYVIRTEQEFIMPSKIRGTTRPRKRLTISLDPEVYDALEEFGAESGYTRSAVGEMAIRAMLANPIPFLPKILTRSNRANDN